MPAPNERWMVPAKDRGTRAIEVGAPRTRIERVAVPREGIR